MDMYSDLTTLKEYVEFEFKLNPLLIFARPEAAMAPRPPPPPPPRRPPPPPPQSPEPEVQVREEKRKRAVKVLLTENFKFQREELPEGIDPDSTYYKGEAANLPSGWVIQQRARPSSGKLDQYFFEAITGKQFRSLKSSLHHLSTKNPSEADTSDRHHDTTSEDNCPWDIIKKINKRKRGAQSLTQPEKPQPENIEPNSLPEKISMLSQEVDTKDQQTQVFFHGESSRSINI